jgi:type III secretion protein Q
VSRPLIFPRMTGSEAQALAALVTHGPGHLVKNLPGELTGHLRLTPLPPGQAIVLAQGTQRLLLEWAGGQLALDVAPWVLDRWLAMVLDVPDIDSLPETFRPVALEHVVNWCITALSAGGRGTAQLTGTQQDALARPEQASHALQLEFELSDGLCMPALLHMDSLALMLMGSLVKTLPNPSSLNTLDDMPVKLELCIGQTELPLTQMASLQSGGLVFLQHNYLGEGQEFLLRTTYATTSRLSFTAKVDGHQLYILSPPHTMNNQTAHSADTDEASATLEQMPVHLSFDLGHKVLTLGQLRQLGEGQALQLDRPIQQGVTIRANGAAIGEGQLLDIDGRMGVLISKLHAPVQDTAE